MIILTITPTENVDYLQKRVIHNSKVKQKTLARDEPIKVFDIVAEKVTNVIAHNVSIYEHRLLLNNEKFHILAISSE